jgi:hypothetical protein
MVSKTGKTSYFTVEWRTQTDTFSPVQVERQDLQAPDEATARLIGLAVADVMRTLYHDVSVRICRVDLHRNVVDYLVQYRERDD